MNWKWIRIPIALLPALIGFAIIVSISQKRVIRFLISLDADYDVIIIAIGIALSIIIAAILALMDARERLRKRDIRRAREEAFAEHHRFLRRLDHELKNPLTAFRAGLANLRASLENDEQIQIMGTLESQTIRLNRLVADLRKLAELETLPLEVSEVDLSELLKESLLLVQEALETSHRQIGLHLPPLLPLFNGDHDLLLLAIHNLLDNAFKYTRSGDQIELRAQAEEETICIEVVDTGIGIPANEIPLVWEELYRGNAAQETAGTGIGLALVQAIIERHAGKVALTSQLNRGTCVQIRLPVT